MKVETRGRGAWVLFLALAAGTSARGEPDPLVGERVVVRHGAQLRLDDGQFIEAGQGHAIYRVEQAADDWLEVVADQQAGWARPADVIPLDRALDYYTAEIQQNPRAAWAYIMRGQLYEELKEPGIALADYNEALRIDPNDAFARLRRGRIRAGHKRDFDRAIADFSEALRLDPRLTRAYAERGQARRALGDHAAAIADYSEALRRDPDDALSRHGRAISHQALGHADDALRDYDEVIRLAPSDPVAYLNRGNLWSGKREYDKAIADYSEAIRLDKTYVLAYNNRGTVWRALRAYDKAVSDHNIALRLQPDDPAAHLDRGIVWKKLGEFERALDDYAEAVRLDPKCAEAYNGRAWIQATCPDAQFRDGAAAYEAAVRSCELTGWKSANHLDTLAAAYAESRDFGRAVAWERKALERADEAQREAFQGRLLLYQARKPYRDASAAPSPVEAAEPAAGPPSPDDQPAATDQPAAEEP